MKEKIKRAHEYVRGVEREVAENKVIYLKDILQGQQVRTSSRDVTCS